MTTHGRGGIGLPRAKAVFEKGSQVFPLDIGQIELEALHQYLEIDQDLLNISYNAVFSKVAIGAVPEDVRDRLDEIVSLDLNQAARASAVSYRGLTRFVESLQIVRGTFLPTRVVDSRRRLVSRIIVAPPS